MAAAAVVDGRDTGFPFPYNETGVTPFGGNFTIATTSLDAANDKVVLFGPFPRGNCYVTKLEVYWPVAADQGAGLVWDLSKGDLDGTIDSGAELIDASTVGQSAGADVLDADNLMFDMSSTTTGKYLILHCKTAAATAAASASVFNVYGEYVNGLLKEGVD